MKHSSLAFVYMRGLDAGNFEAASDNWRLEVRAT